ncbi:MAG: fumarylacetoacetate hydrolase family protein [Gemmatimonadota bacterium]|jgi:2-keto-4-pentenoate hydratase/2-oxohepta-3-ene-1,7-dioic acid hydratase in catechol pathway|nr:fumarylacetoacetate hydrolase family protein [Gemmatimonadota bacterium]MDQ8150090.1 fumarylacetoacetate hydrolase family protein [Gemmatimonadota bacterium]MDQ8151716.1 fumarylacetoacetate hydrolase family protein [Gemmatimonadota bacterium]MDQ8169336.1 fumarylacetoacetate hydrolase family protein [Gemmatimonadota bacterium]MDQ8178195.1 fumarylacetoacetate hydrolase family protein [Gemmatimonadota bacterium]
MPTPGKILCVGRNYREHAKELGNEVPTTPVIFLKPPSSVIASGEAIALPAGIGRIDYEGEIGLVIGQRLTKASPAACAAAVRGVVAVNDVSARDLQKSDPQWWRAKGYDTFCPIGDERQGTPDLAALEVITRVNGEERQRGRSAEMIFPIAEVISFISQAVTLEPGDLVITGTPAGVGPLAPGDVVEVEIPGWSRVRNPVVAAG